LPILQAESDGLHRIQYRCVFTVLPYVRLVAQLIGQARPKLARKDGLHILAYQ